MALSLKLFLVVTLAVVVTGQNDCPPGVPMVACFEDPCNVTSCSDSNAQQCVPYYCGGCYALFYDGDGYLIHECSSGVCSTSNAADSQPIPSLNPCQSCDCFNGELMCAVAACQAPPDGIENCEPIYTEGVCCPSYDHCLPDCDGVAHGDPIPSDDPCETCTCNYGASICAITDCLMPTPYCLPNHPDGECCASYEHCNGVTCPPGVDVHYCPLDPCEGRTCRVRGATCVADYCGGCKYYFVRNGKKIKPRRFCSTSNAADSQPIPSLNPCQWCDCFNGELMCAVAACQAPPDGIENCEPIYTEGVCCPSYDHCLPDCDGVAHGDPIPSDDPCETCTCNYGASICAIIDCLMPTPYCLPNHPDGECCASYEHCNGVTCPPGVDVHYCPLDPCEGRTCRVRGATCVADYCGGCKYYFVRNGKKIKPRRC
ncbi:kielin/chordin-like protein [Amphiura filiformis]|uniref:kielin/chordin-like protein n=1 Tax=Amphiura filiformis TaxID=82378 RepID=UPI003B224D36